VDQEALSRQSSAVNALRYPLIVIVLFIHVLPPQVMELENGLTSRGIYIFVSEFISHYLGSIAVPLFFVFSGYYLFFTPKAWDIKTYQKHLTKKARGLLIPYLFWNLLTLLLEYLRLWVLSRSGGETQPMQFGLDHVWTALTLPMDFPLWYVRDLMIMHLLAPLLVLAYRHLRAGAVLLLLANYLLCQHWYPQLFLTPLATALFYFSLGGYLGLKKIYFPDLFRRWMGLWGTFLVLLLLTMLGYMSYFPTLYIPFGVLAVLASAEHIFDRLPRVKAYCLAREGQVFFIYAVHLIFIENWIKGAFSRTPLAHSGWGLLLSFCVIPFITLAVCTLLYKGLNRLAPRLLSIITGGRS